VLARLNSRDMATFLDQWQPQKPLREGLSEWPLPPTHYRSVILSRHSNPLSTISGPFYIALVFHVVPALMSVGINAARPRWHPTALSCLNSKSKYSHKLDKMRDTCSKPHLHPLTLTDPSGHSHHLY
jgi:hypothetical protein